MITKEEILAEGLEALTEVDTVMDLSDEMAGMSWFETQVADSMQALGLSTDQISSLTEWISKIYLEQDSAQMVASLNGEFHEKDPRTCLVLCRFLTALLYAGGGDEIRRAIEQSGR